MRTFFGIAAGLTLASGVVLGAAGQQVQRKIIVESPRASEWTDEVGLGEDQDPTITRRLAVLSGRGAELGIAIRDLDQQQAKTMSGVVVEDVREGSAAGKAGIKKGDIVTEFDGERVRSARQLARLVNETPDGRTVKTALQRDGKRVELAVTPESGARADRDMEREFEFAVPPGQMEGMPPGHMKGMPGGGAEGRRFYFDMMPPHAGGDRLFRMMPDRGRLGVGIQDLTSQLGEYFGAKDGVLVTSVEADTPAAKAGLKAGDVITSINGKNVTEPGQLIEAVQSAGDGGELAIGYVRDRKPATTKATLEPREKMKVERRGEAI